MSLERATANCERCYVLAGRITRVELERAGPECDPYVESDQLYSARNEAMRALEDSQRACRETVRDLGVKLEQTESGVATQALKACVECDYSTHKIIDVVGDMCKS